MNDESKMPFGQHKGVEMKDVPADYLLWLWNSGYWAKTDTELHRYMKENMNALEMDAPDTIVDHRP